MSDASHLLFLEFCIFSVIHSLFHFSFSPCNFSLWFCSSVVHLASGYFSLTFFWSSSLLLLSMVWSPAEKQWLACSHWAAHTAGACTAQDWIYTLSNVCWPLWLCLCVIATLGLVLLWNQSEWQSALQLDSLKSFVLKLRHTCRLFHLPEQTHS